MTDFAAEELVEQHVVSYTCIIIQMPIIMYTDVQELPWSKRCAFDVHCRSCVAWKLFLAKMPRLLTYLGLAVLLESSFLGSSRCYWSFSTVKHGSFLFAYFLGQIKSLKNHLEICACSGPVCVMMLCYILYSC